MTDLEPGISRSPTTKADKVPYPLAGPAVKKITLPGKSDLSDWIDLMEVVEMLCPVWPERNLNEKRSWDYRL